MPPLKALLWGEIRARRKYRAKRRPANALQKNDGERSGSRALAEGLRHMAARGHEQIHLIVVAELEPRKKGCAPGRECGQAGGLPLTGSI